MAFVDVAIRRARLLQVSIPLRVPFAISGGTLTHRRSLIVELESGDGIRGYGEAAPFEAPFYSAETVASARWCIGHLLMPRMVGETFGDSEAAFDNLTENVRGNHMAIAAVETAWWDLQSRTQSASLAALVDDRLKALGVTGAIRESGALTCGAALGIPGSGSTGALRLAIREALKRGFRRIKLKVKPGWCAHPVRAALEEVRDAGAHVTVSVDGNGAFGLIEHPAELEELDSLGLVFVEQPFAAECLWDSTVWNRRAATPICLDESLTSEGVARQILDMGGPTIWNLKVQRLGGLEATCRVYARGLRAGVGMWIGTMPETGLGVQAALALGGLSGLQYVSDVGPSSWWYRGGSDVMDVEMNDSGEVGVPTTVSGLPRLTSAEVLEAWP